MFFRSVQILIVVLICAARSNAQQSGSFTVTSQPAGAEVTVSGEAVATGITPTTFRFPFVGEHKIVIKRQGYESYKTKVILDPTREASLNATLTPKTAVKAALRSAFIPGWGQRYSDQKTKGFFYHILAAGSIAGFLITDNDYNDKYDRYSASQTAYDKGVSQGLSYSELQALHDKLGADQDEAYSAETRRKIAIGAVAGIWALSIVDAVLFFPNESSSFTVKGLSLAPEVRSSGLTLTLSHRW